MRVQFNSQIARFNNSFKSNITFDIGGSQREGSCKIYYSSTSGEEEFYKKHTTVNDLGKTQFENAEDFLSHIVEKIGKVQKVNKPVIAKKDIRLLRIY